MDITLPDLRTLMNYEAFDKALKYLHEYEQANPENAEIADMIAECYDRMDNWFEAERYYRKTIKLNPTNLIPYTKLEQLVRIQGRHGEAKAILNLMLEGGPETIRDILLTSKAMLELAEGNLKDGFKNYELRFAYEQMKVYIHELFPRWDGKKSLKNKTVVMRYEQGLGDTIQYARYAKVLKDMGAKKVVIFCKETLNNLLQSVPGVDDVTDNLTGAKFDYEVLMMSFPALLNIETEVDIPHEPYIFVEEGDQAEWLHLMLPTGKKKVGLVWSGEGKNYLGWEGVRMNNRRSIPLDLFRPILDNDCDFYSLQYGERSKDLKGFFAAHKIKDLTYNFQDFYSTACLIANLDLVIAVDTSVAHLAGAMGKPVWLLSRVDGDWRWMLDRRDTPWYPSMEIFRQKVYAEWRPTILEVAERLRNL